MCSPAPSSAGADSLPMHHIDSVEHWRDADVIGYVRKSVVLGEADRISEVKQRDAIEREIDRLQLAPPAWFQDTHGHRSGRYEHTRPGWRQAKQRFLSSAKAVLIVFNLDRSNRNVRDTADLIETIKRKTGSHRVIFIANRFDSALDGWSSRIIRMLLNDAVAAQSESDDASDRMRDTITTLKTRLVPWGTTPYGLVREGKGMRARWDLGERAGDVRSLFELWAQPGGSYGSVSQMLNDRGCYYSKARRDQYGNRSEMPQRWTPARVRQIVANVLTYAGYLMPRGGHARARKIKPAPGSTLLEQYARSLNAQRSPAITQLIDDALAERVCVKSAHRQRTYERRKGEWRAMLSGLLHWRERPLRAQQNAGIRYYRTAGRNSASWHAEDLDARVIALMRGVSFPPAVRDALRAALATNDDNRDVDEAKRKIEEMKAALLSLDRKSALGHFEGRDDAYAALRDEFTASLRSAEQRAGARSSIDTLLATVSDLGREIDLMSDEERRLALYHLFSVISIDDGGEIERIEPRPWAALAFGQIVAAWRKMPAMRRSVHSLTPTGLEQRFSTNSTEHFLGLLAA